MKEYFKPIAILFLIIIFCSALVRIFSRSESLSDYAAKNAKLRAEETEPSEQIPELPITADADPVNESNSQTASQPDTNAEAETSAVPGPDETASTEIKSDTPAEISRENAELYFYYEPLSDGIIARITGISYVENENISLDDLRYMHILHYNFNDEITEGELICNKSIAQDLLEIFYELFLSEYKIEKVRLIDEYDGDDTASMEDNNTSCFNYRVVDGTSSLSKHAYGLAVDINPFYNPYVVFQSDGSTYISPAGSESYADRSLDFPYKIDDEDLCYKLFKEHGFVWGGNWNSCKDYQHFQKTVE